MITAKIVEASVNSSGNRITSWVLTYPRFIHSELMTHRMFSRNAASSRAIPIKKMLDWVINNPAMPEHWGANQKGMQADVELSAEEIAACKVEWLKARDNAVETVRRLSDLNLHKQVANRLLEPWPLMTVLLTATEYGNFFALRAHPDAQPEFRMLAYQMLPLYQASVPKLLQPGEWHLPFNESMPGGLDLSTKLKIVVARAARVSYVNFEGKIDPNEDIALHDRLLQSGHMSPFEHVAYAAPGVPQIGNFKGWVQYRKMIHTENRDDPRIPRVHPPPLPSAKGELIAGIIP